MQTKKWLFRQSTKFIATAILGLAIGLILFLINNRSNLPPTITVYHPSTSTIEMYIEKEEFSNAYNEAVKYSEEHLNDSTAYQYLGLSLFQLGKYNESTQNFELALQDETLATSTKAEVYYFIGRNYFHLKDYDKTLFYSQKAIQLNPNYSLAYDAVGMLMIKQEKYKEALPFFEKELSLIPDSENNPLSSYPYYYLAKVYFNTNNYPEAQQMIEMAEKLAKELTKPKPSLFLQNIEMLKSEIDKKS